MATGRRNRTWARAMELGSCPGGDPPRRISPQKHDTPRPAMEVLSPTAAERTPGAVRGGGRRRAEMQAYRRGPGMEEFRTTLKVLDAIYVRRSTTLLGREDGTTRT